MPTEKKRAKILLFVLLMMAVAVSVLVAAGMVKRAEVYQCFYDMPPKVDLIHNESTGAQTVEPKCYPANESNWRLEQNSVAQCVYLGETLL